MFGYQLKTVLSGSMEPGIKTGSIIAVKPGGDTTRFKAGDVITFRTDEEGTLTTHRVVEAEGSGDNLRYITKGDNNNAADIEPILHQNVVAEYTGLTVPYVGYILSHAQTKLGSALLLVIPGLLILGYAIVNVISALREIDGGKKQEASNSEQ